MTLLFDLILMAMAVYILVGALSRKGKLFKADNIKEGKEEEFKKYSRIIYVVLGCAMFLHSLCTVVQNLLYAYDPETQAFVAVSSSRLTNALSYQFLRVISIIFFVMMILAFVVLIILMKKYKDQRKVKQQQVGRPQNENSILPVHAPGFEEDEMTMEKNNEMEAAKKEEEEKHPGDCPKQPAQNGASSNINSTPKERGQKNKLDVNALIKDYNEMLNDIYTKIEELQAESESAEEKRMKAIMEGNEEIASLEALHLHSIDNGIDGLYEQADAVHDILDGLYARDQIMLKQMERFFEKEG